MASGLTRDPECGVSGQQERKYEPNIISSSTDIFNNAGGLLVQSIQVRTKPVKSDVSPKRSLAAAHHFLV